MAVGFPEFWMLIVAVLSSRMSSAVPEKEHSFTLKVAGFPDPTLAYRSLPSLLAELFKKEQVSMFTIEAEPLPENPVLIAIAPPFPLEEQELFENEQLEMDTVAPRPTLIAPPYAGPPL